MSTITKNFEKFIAKELNLSSNVITDSLGTISRWNIFSRFAHSKELDSRNVCETLEAKINEVYASLSEQQKAVAALNLKAMKSKFLKSIDSTKGQACANMIDGILAKIASSASSKNAQSVKPTERRRAPKTTAEPVVVQVNHPAPITQAAVKQSAAPSKPVFLAQAQDPHHAQKKLVEAISRSTLKTTTTAVTSAQIAPDMERISKREIGVTEADRLKYNFKRHLVYYRHEDKYYFNALVKQKGDFGYTCKQTLVEAAEIKQQVQEIQKKGSFDVGALLREKMQQMGMQYEVRQ